MSNKVINAVKNNTESNPSNSARNAYIDALESNVLTVFEHQRLTVHDFAQASDFRWLMAQELTVFSIKRQQGQWQLKVGHYIGVILLPSGVSLEILPKLNQSIQRSDITQTRHWVQNMLTDLMSSNEHNQRKLPNTKNLGQFSSQLAALPKAALPLSDWLTTQFLQQLAHYQPTTHYQTQIQNQASLQGRLLIKEQLRHNSMQPHKFICESSALSQEMLANRLIKSALQLLSPLLLSSKSSNSKSSNSKSSNSNASPYLQPWRQITTLTEHEKQRLSLIYAAAKRELAIQPLRVQKRHAAQRLVDLAYWLLQQSASATGNGMNTPLAIHSQQSPPRLCLLIDMNQAFEQWASQRIASMFQQLNNRYRPLYQTQRVWLSDEAGQASLSIRPDLLIYQVADTGNDAYQVYESHQGQNKIKEKIKEIKAENLEIKNLGHYSHVIDIKWKPLTSATDIRASDAYQLASYAQAYQAEQVWLVYPVCGEHKQPVALTQQIYQNQMTGNNDKVTPPAQLWLIPFDVLTGTINRAINGGLLPKANVV